MILLHADGAAILDRLINLYQVSSVPKGKNIIMQRQYHQASLVTDGLRSAVVYTAGLLR